MNLHRSKAARAAATVAALAILVGPSAAGAWAQDATPEPTPEATTTDEAAEEQAHDDGKHRPSVPKDNVFALGQSMQIRVNADGEQNAKLVNFRWSVSHLTIQGPPDGSKDGEYVVPVPEAGTLPRYLENFGFIHVENGYGEWDMNVENGWDTQRSVSIFPQDSTPNISLKTEFTLDGEPVKAQDIVGKDGLVTATYTLINNTTKTYDLTVQDINGADVQTTAEGDSPMVAITKTLLPQRYIGLNTGAGIFGADGRGNNQVQWISLPFKPLAENSQASFGWAAYVTDAVIPSLLTQVSPLYIPAHDPEAEEAEEAESESSAPPIPLDPAIAQIQAGLAQLQTGLADLAATKPADSGPPCDESTDVLVCIDNGIGNLISFILGVAIPTPLLTALNPDPAAPEANRSITVDQSEWRTIQDTVQKAAAAYTETDQSALVAASPQDCSVLIVGSGTRESCNTLNDDMKTLLPPRPVDVAGAQDLAARLTGEITATDVKIGNLTTLYNGLANPDVTVDLLPTTEQAITELKTELLGRGLDDVQAGLDTVSGGVAQAKDIVASYLASLSVQVQQAIAQVQAGVVSANDAIIHLRGNIGALKAAAAESPLIYGPLPPGTPEGTVLAGAYEFRIDAADTNHPYTLPRILVGLIALIAAGFVVKYLGNRNTVA